MSTPLLSIIIPTYSRAVMIRQTLDSILNQTLIPDGLEVLVSNDCSKDDTACVLAEYQARMPYLQVFNQTENLGGTRNWDFLQKKAKGEYIFILCDDDAIAPDFVESNLGVFESDPSVDMVTGDIELRGPDFEFVADLPLDETPEGPLDGPSRCVNQLRSHHMVMSSVYRRKTLMEAGGWDHRVGSHLDCNAFCRTALRSRVTYRLARPMLYFRLTPTSWSRNLATEQQAHVATFYRRKLDFLVEDARLLAPHILPDLEASYLDHARNVMAGLELELAHGRLSGPRLRKAVRDLVAVFPEARGDRMTRKLWLASYLGTGWLSAVRKVLGKPDPYQSKLAVFNSFGDPASASTASISATGVSAHA